MTLQEWLTATDPAAMLEHLVGKASERKLRLFACGCCRRVWNLLPDAGRAAVGSVERMVDERPEEAPRAPPRLRGRGAGQVAVSAVEHLLRGNIAATTRDAALAAGIHFADAPSARTDWAKSRDDAVAAERKKQCEVLRDIFGNPFAPAPAIEPVWLGWNQRAIPQMAALMYREHSFQQLPKLAEWFTLAGFKDAGVMEHCRGRAPHVRGCWLIDLILGKK